MKKANTHKIVIAKKICEKLIMAPKNNPVKRINWMFFLDKVFTWRQFKEKRSYGKNAIL